MNMVTVLISAGGASVEMLDTCLSSIYRHPCRTNMKIVLVCPSHQCDSSHHVSSEYGVEVWDFEVADDDLTGSAVHGRVLDESVKRVVTPYLMTLDADCFPVCDGWMDFFVNSSYRGYGVTGILHPYAPPYGRKTEGIEKRIRSQLCWDNTHVACQMIRTDLLSYLGVGFSDGDDTGLAIPIAARRQCVRVGGLFPSCCAIPDDTSVDAESNREICVLYGDMIYHHGGGARDNQGRGCGFGIWDSVRSEVLRRKGAEFILEEDKHHKYRFDMEEEISSLMARRIMRGMLIHLQNNDGVYR